MPPTTATIVSAALPRKNLVDQVYLAIRKGIATGELLPGWQLKIDSLSSELEVSSTPIREALRRLEHERWIEVIPYRGAFVRPIDATEIEELYEIREILETAALRKAMPSVAPGSLKLLDTAASDIRAALARGDQAGYMTADAHFHEIIVQMAGNERLSQIFSTLAQQGRCFLLGRTAEAMGRAEEEADQHDQLLATIREDQTRAALQLLRQHLRFSRDELRQLSAHNRRNS